jgi:hypothetical protein
VTTAPPSRPAPSGFRLLSVVSRLIRPGAVRGGCHRDVQGSAARAGVLGAGDGLITNISLILGVAGASTSATAVRVAGIAGLLAGGFSMARGNWSRSGPTTTWCDTRSMWSEVSCRMIRLASSGSLLVCNGPGVCDLTTPTRWRES